MNVTSKFAICPLPLRVDSYKTCSFQCRYCFANYRKIMEFEKKLKIANLDWLNKKLHQIYNEKNFDKKSFLDMLIKNKITWHFGGMSDPFQPIENKLNITMKMVDLANWYDISILFSTKADTYYNATVNPKYHSFQLSITNLVNDDIEPNVPDINNRIRFFKQLKDEGFKVGIRIQPFIPKITTSDIVDTFRDADYFTIEGLKIVPQNKEQKSYLLNRLNLNRGDFIQMGLLNLKPNIRLRLYTETLDKLEQYNIPYSLADNDLHHISKSGCCCGEPLVKKYSCFSDTSMYHNKIERTEENIEKLLGEYKDCIANNLFTSNRQDDCKTVKEFFDIRLNRDSSPFSDKFMYGYRNKNQRELEVN